MADNQEKTELEKQEETRKNKPARDENGRLLPGNTANPNGRPPLTEADKIKKKAVDEFITEYKEKLAESLPLISPVLIAKALEGDVPAIKEVHDRVMGKATQKLEMSGGLDLSVLENSIKQIANGRPSTENPTVSPEVLQGRDGATNESNGKPVSDIPPDIKQALQ
jgi:hypothetical protein